MMQNLKLFPIFAVLGVVYAKEKRSDCLKREAQASLDSSPPDADIAICYHGENSAYTNKGDTVKTPDVFGGLRWADCDGIGLDCFWMKGENIFQFWGDGGSDNLAYVKRNADCKYFPEDKTIYCDTSLILW